MVDTASIIIAVVSLVGSLVAALFTGWISYYLDQAKQRKATTALIRKYRDPLTLAALLDYVEDAEKRENIYTYTAFLIGQYLSWTYILRRQAQFLRFSTEKTNQELNQILDSIKDQFSKDYASSSHSGEEDPLMLWRGQQMAIGELMTLQEEGGQLYCMGYAAFTEKYHHDPEFSKWFDPIKEGIDELVSARRKENHVITFRLRRLQHLLIDLVLLLDPYRVTIEKNAKAKVDPAADSCKCKDCQAVVQVRQKEKLTV
ncbi:ccch zinc finger protein [Rutstroemia sp. NJR-2017a BBW]|nr:ccch zinc finger protein [Rutstroemia sp. NJR-2017a BBW]